jgi:hypothetical protein
MAKAQRIYRAHPNASFGDKEAQWIGEQLEKNGGTITPEQFVELCRPVKSPGHSLFTWDVHEAAHAHWIERAQYHLRHVEIEIISDGNKERIRACIPVVHADAGDSLRPYTSYDRIKDAPDLSRQVIEQAAYELKSWQNRYALYRRVFGSAFEPVFLAITSMEKELWPQRKPSTASRKTARLRKAK